MGQLMKMLTFKSEEAHDAVWHALKEWLSAGELATPSDETGQLGGGLKGVFLVLDDLWDWLFNGSSHHGGAPGQYQQSRLHFCKKETWLVTYRYTTEQNQL